MSISGKALSIFSRDVFLFVTNLVTGVVVARALGPQALGFWVILQLIPSYAEAFARLKFDVAAVYVIGRGEHRKEDVLLHINLLALATSVVAVGLIWWQLDFLSRVLFAEDAATLRVPLLVLLAQIPLQFFYLNYAYLHLADEDVGVYNRMVVIRALTNSLMAIVLLLFLGLGLWAVVLASLASMAAGLAYGWVKVDRTEFGRPRLTPRIIKELTAYGWQLYTGGVLAHLNRYATRLIAVFFLTPMQVAFFGLAQGAGQLLDRVPQAIGTILFPRISRSASDVAVGLASNAFRVSFVLLLVGGTALAIVAYRFVTLLYGEPYGPAAAPLRIMLPGLVIAGAGSMLGQYFQGVGRPELLPRIALVPVLVQIAAATALTPLWGLNGAALAVSVGLGSVGILQAAAFLRITGSGIRCLVPGRGDVAQILALVRSSAGRIHRPDGGAPSPVAMVVARDVDITAPRPAAVPKAQADGSGAAESTPPGGFVPPSSSGTGRI